MHNSGGTVALVYSKVARTCWPDVYGGNGNVAVVELHPSAELRARLWWDL